ncbi:MAG TPA: GNAT family N-acetyltransferase [Candidatus Limnocylindria bacterium]|nr:GNAT family N-acetyltransferase [Candidatus Limnocylindria bacterium]
MSRLPDGVTLRDATSEDLPAIAGLRESVGWGVHEWALRAVIGEPSARCLVAADRSDQVVAVGSGIAYGPLGFVGNMVVAPEVQRRGLGSAILGGVIGFLEAAGCVRLELNATSEGRPLYERHGFHSTGTSATAEIPRGLPLKPDLSLDVRVAINDDLEALRVYDRPRFGGDRRRIMELLLADAGATVLAAASPTGVAGYACVRADGGRIGPFLADTPAVAETLLASAFERAPDVGTLRVNLPPGNDIGTAWLRGLGVETIGWDGRMARGAELPKREETLYGMAVGALG